MRTFEVVVLTGPHMGPLRSVMNFASNAGRLAVTESRSNRGRHGGAAVRWFAAPMAAVAALVLFSTTAARGQHRIRVRCACCDAFPPDPGKRI